MKQSPYGSGGDKRKSNDKRGKLRNDNAQTKSVLKNINNAGIKYF